MGDHAIVTGGASGIGLAIAARLAEGGNQVLILDSDVTAGEAAKTKLLNRGLACTFIETDISQWAAATEAVELLPKGPENRWILVNNAAIKSNSGLLQENASSWGEQIAVMLTATFSFSQAFISSAMEFGACGSICNIGSVLANLSGSGQSPAYHAAKAGVAGLTRFLAVESGRVGANITVNAVEPGLIIQDRHRERFEDDSNAIWRATCESYQPSGQVGSERDVAEAVHWLTGRSAKYVNGVALRIDGGAGVQEQFSLLKSGRIGEN
jgi:NAD(P)-dependent dehydrogenase (short-subunit alcohol dehydrogenase family)